MLVGDAVNPHAISEDQRQSNQLATFDVCLDGLLGHPENASDFGGLKDWRWQPVPEKR